LVVAVLSRIGEKCGVGMAVDGSSGERIDWTLALPSHNNSRRATHGSINREK